MTTSLIASLLAVVWLGADPNALATRFEQARALFDGGRYPEAAAAFERLQVETGEPALLYPTAQSFRLAGRCSEALHAYEMFVAATPDLRARAEAAKPGTDLKRLLIDLQLARARTIEMRVCVARARSTAARSDGQRLAAAGNQSGAVTILEGAWNETQDPTLLPDLAAVHRAAHACSLARETLDLAGTRLAALEALADDPAPSADLLTARWAWREARVPSGDRPCVEAPVASVVPVAQTQTALLTAPPLPESKRAELPPAKTDQPVAQGRPSWPLWGVAGGAGLAAAGVACLLKADQLQREVEAAARDPDRNGDAQNLDRRGHLYNNVGIGLAVGGAVVGTAALIYYFSSKGAPSPTTARLQISPWPASMIWTLAF